jgi:hypothetical protein
MGNSRMAWTLYAGVVLGLAAADPASAAAHPGPGDSSPAGKELLRGLEGLPLTLSSEVAGASHDPAALVALPVDLVQDQAPAPEAPGPEKKEESPWLLAPLLSLNPKLGFSAGAIIGYMFYFDEKSKFSMIGINGQYTSTGSTIAGLVSKLSFGEDHHRIIALAFGGNIKNDYEDFLGTGVPLKSSDELRALFGRYLYRFWGDFFVGAQGISTNYAMIGDSIQDEQALSVLGLGGFRSAGLGAVLFHDSRDSETAPTRGLYVNANNVAYREALAGEENFDVYRLDTRYFIPEGGGHVLALRQMNQWTVDAPSSAFAPVQLRGYKMGQYLGENMSSIEAEQRFRLGDRFSATVFTGVAFLYGNGQSLNDPNTIYPAAGAGLQFILKQKEGIVANLEFAAGKRENYGVYIKLGYGF